ncbi:MAG: DNA recombination protein RmuC [Candidatus Omnitrophota bacterium]
MIWVITLLFLFLAAVVVSVVFRISSEVSRRLAEMNRSIQEANNVIAQNLGHTSGIFGSIQERLGGLQKTNEQVYEVARNISSLQELLRAPKFRGELGETFLENLLSQVLPRDYYQMQYRFRSSDAVDAVIRLGGRLVPVDAKFSLENFQRMLESPEAKEKESYRRKFIQDVKSRIEEISSKYILPEEDTYDFALMYIPAENVYYETIVREDLLGYCLNKKVIPVSPHTFYAYLQVICLGLKGLKIEENAKNILKGLSAFGSDIARFRDDFDTLGGHLANAGHKYEDSRLKLERLSERLDNIQKSDNPGK